MRLPRALLAGMLLVPSLSLSGCLGVTEKHSTLVKEVPVNINFKSTPTPAPSATPGAPAGAGGARP